MSFLIKGSRFYNLTGLAVWCIEGALVTVAEVRLV